MKRSIAVGAALVVLASVIAVLAPAAVGGAPKAKCPSGGVPAPGSKVNGGLEVDGVCPLNNVTINGGVVVDSTGRLGLNGNDSTANGGITVNGGELDLNHQLAGSFSTGTTARVAGGITINGSIDFDLYTAKISGPINITGVAGGSAPTICGNDISGGVSVTNLTSPGLFIGDPEDPVTFSTEHCPGNTIHGPVTLTNVHVAEVEGNTITGPVTFDSSTLEFAGNTITGPSRCVNGTVITPSGPPDPPSDPCTS